MGQPSSKTSSNGAQRNNITKSSSLPSDLNKTSKGSNRNSSTVNKSTRKSLIKHIITHTQQIKDQLQKQELSNEDIDRFQKVLIDYSQQLAVRKKSEDIDVQKLISSTLRDLVAAQNDTSSSSGSRSKRQTQARLGAIENRFDALHVDIVMATENRQLSQLDSISDSIADLMTDLQMLTIEPQTVQEQKKDNLEKNLRRSYRKIEKTKSLIIESDGEDEDDINANEDIVSEAESKIISELSDIEKCILAIELPQSEQKVDLKLIETYKGALNKHKNKLNLVEDVNTQIRTKKDSLGKQIENLERSLMKIEVVTKLHLVDRDVINAKTDLNKFVQTTKSDAYQAYQKYFTDLQEYVKKIAELNQNVSQKKQTVLTNIEECLQILHAKAKENEENAIKLIQSIQKEPEQAELVTVTDTAPATTQETEVIVREKKIGPKTAPKSMGFTPFNKLIASYEEFNRSFHISSDIDYLRNMHKTLNNIKLSIEEKLIQIDNVLKTPNGDVEIVNVRLETLPKVEHVSPVNTRNSVVKSNETIGQVKNMQKEIDSVHEQIKKTSVYKKDSEDYRAVKGQLQSHKKTLQRFSIYKNDNIRSSAENLLKNIEFVLQLLEAKTSKNVDSGSLKINRKSTTENILNEVMSISTRIGDLGNRINAMKFISVQDYNGIKQSLVENIKYLKRLEFGGSNKNILKSRDEIVNEGNNHLMKLEDLMLVSRSSSNINSSEERELNQALNTLKDKVSRFSGTYKNVLYKKLENDLNSCLSTVDNKVKDKKIALQIKSDIENNLKILEQKSIKDQQYGQVYQRNSVESIKLGKIKTDVDNVRAELNNLASQKSRKDFEILDGRLNLAIMDLGNLNLTDDKINEQKQKLYNEIDQHVSFINHQLGLIDQQNKRIVVTEPSSSQQSSLQSKTDKRSEAAEEFDVLEQDLKNRGAEIDGFMGLETSEKFFELDEFLVQITLRVDRYKFEKGDAMNAKKFQLIGQIQKLSEILDERSEQTEFMEEMEKQIGQTMMKIDSLSTYISDEEFNSLDEFLINLKLKLHKSRFNEKLTVRKNACIKDIDDCLKKLNEAAGNRDRLNDGTLV